jgi:hypothetical protein
VSEAPALPALGVHALVIDARRLDPYGAGPDRHPPLAGATVAHDQVPALLVALVGEPLDVLVSLRLKRRGDHPARTVARELVQRDRNLVVLPDGEPANIAMACLPSPPHGGRSLSTGKVRRPPPQPVHNIRVWLRHR